MMYEFVDNDALYGVMSTPSGRKVIWQLLEHSAPLNMSFVAGNPELTAFNEGRRSFGVSLLAQLMNEHQNLYFRMVNENQGDNDDGHTNTGPDDINE